MPGQGRRAGGCWNVICTAQPKSNKFHFIVADAVVTPPPTQVVCFRKAGSPTSFLSEGFKTVVTPARPGAAAWQSRARPRARPGAAAWQSRARPARASFVSAQEVCFQVRCTVLKHSRTTLRTPTGLMLVWKDSTRRFRTPAAAAPLLVMEPNSCRMDHCLQIGYLF